MDETLTILIVDDDEIDRKAVRRALRAAGLALVVEEAADSTAALTALEQRPFDCVFLDYRLPDRDGLAVLHAIRACGLLVPVVVLTGQGDERLAVELMKAGASDYLSKGTLTAEILAQALRSAIRVQRAEASAAQATRALSASVERLRFLAEASRLLASSLDAPVILSALARLVVQNMADWCEVDVVGDDGGIQRLVIAAADPLHEVMVPEIQRLPQLGAEVPGTPASVIAEGKPLLLDGIHPAHLERLDAEHRALIESFAISGLLIVPLSVRGRVLGALTLAATHGRRFSPEDQALAEDLAYRTAVAVDNARLYHEAREAVRLRDVFLSVASHELKTPLTSLFGNAQLLQRRLSRQGGLSERDQRTLQVLVEQANRLNKMITALLDISRLQTGQFSIQREPVDLCALVLRLAEELRPALDQHTINVSSDGTALPVIGDELRLEQVLHNLIQNAIKYSPSGGAIEVHMERRGQQAAVAVIDQGIGIPADALPHLFSRFYRANNVQDQQISGIGLGLYVVSEIVALHGGSVEVVSEEGSGSTFTIYLPLANQAETPLEECAREA
ncbi:MAG TPA: ATP-binding protein [Roseiflexaceae bacterium]|nr:ATP-binding protein [Roseiflexaceae bacterium]